jgi:Xaa-Pro aminopeptidase
MGINIPFNAPTYENRRSIFINNVKTGKYLFVGNDDVGGNYLDDIYPFKQDSSFLYFFGINKPCLVGLIDADAGESMLFGDDISLDYVIWMGKQPSMAELAEKVGIKKVADFSKLSDYCDEQTHFLPPYRGDQSILIQKVTGVPIDQQSSKASVKMIKAVVKQRSIKEGQEIEALDEACYASGVMHEAVIKAVKPGLKEYELIAVAAQNALSQGGRWSFNPIATINGQTLHNHYYGNELVNGKLFLFDGGYQSITNYVGDLTRTTPVNGKFTNIQAEVYNIVLAAYTKAVTLLQPGVSYREIHLASAAVIFDGLKGLGICKGETNEAVAAGAHSVFFPHGLGHMMGLDVHDMENLGEQYVGYTDDLIKSTQFGLKSLRLGRDLEEGFVLTVEPGIYFIPELIDKRNSEGAFKEFINYDVLEKFKSFGGIRIEDDYAITNDGSRLLGKNLAKTIDELCELRGS